MAVTSVIDVSIPFGDDPDTSIHVLLNKAQDARMNSR